MSIALTDAQSILTTLGDNTSTEDYDKVVYSPITMNPVAQTIVGNIRLTASATPTLPTIIGSFAIDLVAATFEVLIPQVDFQAHLALSAGQVTTVQGWIDDAQDNLESGSITVGVMAGIQTTGV